MKKNLLSVMFLLTMTSMFSQELITFESSNQSITTNDFEKNEYDYLINPLYFNMLTDPWLFLALDGDGSQLGGKTGIKAGWATGNTKSLVFLINYSTTSVLKLAEENDNTEITKNNYDNATGKYSTIVKDVDQKTKDDHNVHNLIFHTGLSLTDKLALALQFQLVKDDFNVSEIEYSDTYSNTATIKADSLTSKGDVTETEINMRSSNDNMLNMDIEVGFNTKKFATKVVLGLGLVNIGLGDNSYENKITSTNGGSDSSLIDTISTTSYTGQYYVTKYSDVYYEKRSINMDEDITDNIETFHLALGTETIITMDGNLELVIPLNFKVGLYPTSLESKEITNITSYNDLTSLEMQNTSTTETTSLEISNDFNIEGGVEAKKSFNPTDKTNLYLGGLLGLRYTSISDKKNRTNISTTMVDYDSDGKYLTPGIDVNTTKTKNTGDIEISNNNFYVIPSIYTSVSFTPVSLITFHAAGSSHIYMSYGAINIKSSGSSYLYEQYTDNLVSENSYTKRQINGSYTETTETSTSTTAFNLYTTSSFGFTLNFSDDFKVDAKATAKNVNFNEFSVMAIYSF